MFSCPACQRRCIPLWRTLFLPPLFAVFQCQCCATRVRRVRCRWEYVASVPFYCALLLVFGARTETDDGIAILLTCGLLSMLVWLACFIRYEIAVD